MLKFDTFSKEDLLEAAIEGRESFFLDNLSDDHRYLASQEIERLHIIKGKDYSVFNAKDLGYDQYNEDVCEEAVMCDDFAVLKRITPLQTIEEYAASVKSRMGAFENYKVAYQELRKIQSRIEWSYSEGEIRIFSSVRNDYGLDITVQVLNRPKKIFVLDLYEGFDNFKDDIISYISTSGCRSQEIIERVVELLDDTKECLEDYNNTLNRFIVAESKRNRYKNIEKYKKIQRLIATYYTDTIKIDFIEDVLIEPFNNYYTEAVNIDFVISIPDSDEILHFGTIARDIYNSDYTHGLVWEDRVKHTLFAVSDKSTVAHRLCSGANFIDFSEAFTELAFILLSEYMCYVYPHE